MGYIKYFNKHFIFKIILSHFILFSKAIVYFSE